MSDDILEALQRNADSLRRNGWGSAPFDVAAEEIKNLRARVAELEAELKSMCFNHEQAMGEAKRLRSELAQCREQTARECAVIADDCDKSTHPAEIADRIRKKFGVME